MNQLNLSQRLHYGAQYVGNPEFAEKICKVVLFGRRNSQLNDPGVRNAMRIMECGHEFPFHFRNVLAHNSVESVQSKFNPAFLPRARSYGTVLAGVTTDSDFVDRVTNTARIFETFPSYDTGILQAFDEGFFEEGKKEFEILKGGGAITMYPRQTGEKIKTSDWSENIASYPFQSFGGGINWDYFLSDTATVSSMVLSRTRFNESIISNYAGKLYQVLVQAALNNATDPLVTTGANALENRRLTLNKSTKLLDDDLKDERGVSVMAPLLLYINYDAQRQADMIATLSRTVGAGIGADLIQVARAFTVIPTRELRDGAGNFLDPKYAVMCYPGRENVVATKRTPAQFSDTDVERLLKLEVAEHAFGAGANNIKQQRVVQLWAS